MNDAVRTILILLPTALGIILFALIAQWVFMKREQKRIEDLVELRARGGRPGNRGVAERSAGAGVVVQQGGGEVSMLGGDGVGAKDREEV